MIRPSRQSLILLPILTAAFVALSALGALQYYWVDQVSESERARMQANLRTGATRFAEDFDRELARVYLSFQMDGATLRDRDWERYARRYDRWQATAPYAGLVDQIYLAKIGEGDTLLIERYDPAGRRFVPASWTAELTSIRLSLLQAYRRSYVESGMLVSSAPDPVAADVPALLIPVSRTWMLSDRKQLDFEARFLFGDTIIGPADGSCLSCETVTRGSSFVAHTIVTLSRTYLERSFIPALGRRYFATGDMLDYDLAITSASDPSRAIYRSGPPQATPGGDAVVDLFGVRPDELNRFLLDDSLHVEDQSESPPRHSSIAILARGSADSPAAPGRWRLTITHRSGSLDQAVADLRLRNLGISLGTMLLLAAAILLVIVLARRAHRLAQQKIDFVTVVSHELRTPLSVICSAGENLADGVIRDADRARQYGAVIRGEGRRLTEMVEQVLAFAEIQSGRRSYDLAPLDVAAVVARAISACEMQVAAAGGSLDVEVQEGLPAVAADDRALRNAVQNLVSNAVKYGGERPWVGVRVSAARGMRGAEVQIAVSDRGAGIPVDDLPHIFEPFYRGREAMAAQIQGSGLGLGLVRHVAQAHGGRVSVESARGRGSTFTLHIPALPAALSEGRPPVTAGS